MSSACAQPGRAPAEQKPEPGRAWLERTRVNWHRGAYFGITSIEILDLRHFAAPMLRPVLEAEGELWSKRLHWDYRASARC